MAVRGRRAALDLLVALCTFLAISPRTIASSVEYLEQDVDELEEVAWTAQEDYGGNSIGRDAGIKDYKSQNRCRYVCEPGGSIGVNVRKIICKPTVGRTITKVLKGNCCPDPGMKRCTHHRQEVCRKNFTWVFTGKECGFKKCTVKERRKEGKPEVKKFIAHRTDVCFFRLTPGAKADLLVSRRQGRHSHCCRRCNDGMWESAICSVKKTSG